MRTFQCLDPYPITSPSTQPFCNTPPFVPLSFCTIPDPYLPFLSSVLLFCHYLTSWEGLPRIKAVHCHPFRDNQQTWDNWVSVEVPLKPTVPF
eukprot:superscaffoldBa00002245_g13642